MKLQLLGQKQHRIATIFYCSFLLNFKIARAWPKRNESTFYAQRPSAWSLLRLRQLPLFAHNIKVLNRKRIKFYVKRRRSGKGTEARRITSAGLGSRHTTPTTRRRTTTSGAQGSTVERQVGSPGRRIRGVPHELE